ncbi:MAG TPA: flagellar hook-basal body complex protein FliE [Rhizobiaceae bacterium]
MIAAIGPLDFSRIGGASGLPGGGANTAAAATGAAGSFATVLSDLATRTVGTLEHAEQMSVQGLQGQADTREIVDAVMSAEQALTAAVAIRDKIVSAYMEISRMAI